MTVEKLKMHSPDLTERNIDMIAELFPAVVTETLDADGNPTRGVDFDALRQELSDHIVEGSQERYRLDWPGKRAAAFAANAPIAKTLRPVREESVDFDTTKNLFIEGDNLDALKLLQESYLGRVKLIYIDPPYNTGSDRFVYDDDFAEASDEFLLRSGQVNDLGERIQANTDSSGRFHSDWLGMMYPRLKLARSLLAIDGVIFVSIDDHELPRLRSLMDEVFGGHNFVANVIWHKVHTIKNTAKHFSEDHEYLLVYARNADEWEPNPLPRTDEQDRRFTNPDGDPRGAWISGPIQARNYYSRGLYSITTPGGRVVEGPPPGSYWRFSEEKFRELDADGRIYWGATGNNVPRIKRFLSEMNTGRVPQTYWPYSQVGHSQDAKNEVLARVDFASDQVFDTPKPTKLIRRMLSLATAPGSDDIVIDFFAGSGATADAVFQQNAEDGGSRRFILVQLPDDGDGRQKGVPEVAKERIRNAGRAAADAAGLNAEGLDVGFRSMRVDTTNMAEVDASADALSQGEVLNAIDSVKPDRTDEDLLFQVLLDWGLDLSLPIGREVSRVERAGAAPTTYFRVAGDALIACFSEEVSANVVTEIANLQPLRAVFRDSAFKSDADRINAEQLFRELSPNTEVKTI